MHRKWGSTDHLFAADTASGLYNAKLELSTLWRRIFTVEDQMAIVPTGSEKTCRAYDASVCSAKYSNPYQGVQ
jgi:hypothetical protein